MATSNEPVPLPQSLTPGNPDLIEEMTIASMAEAMELAKQNLRTPIDDDPDPYGYVQEMEDQYGVDLLNPQWKARPDDSRWVKRLKARARKTAVVRQFLMGYQPHQIAEKVKCSETTVHRDLRNAEREWRRTYLDDIEMLAGKDLARYDYLISKLAPAIERGDVKSISVAADIIDKRAKILGYQQGVQVDVEQYVREVAESEGFDPDRAVAIASRISIHMRG